MSEPVGIYLHIPFCKQKCPYCDFYSVVSDDALMDRYVDALIAEIKTAPKVVADSLYLGGGTPILLGADRLCRLLDAVTTQFALSGEITLEANPNATDYPTLKTLRQAGYNRISFGVQSTSAQELGELGRLHDKNQAIQAVLLAKKAGFTDISVDLMIGTPKQTLPSLLQSVDILTKLPITHLSAYLLKVEARTPYAKMTLDLPDEDTVTDGYLAVVARLKQRGLLQYEISNFAKEGFESKHNLKYWQGKPYLGFGPAASSFFDGKRTTHTRDLQSYLQDPASTVVVEETSVDGLQEAVLLGLRLSAGVDFSALQAQYGFDLQAVRARMMRYQSAGYAIITGNHMRLTPQGFLLSNSIITDLLTVIKM